MYREGVRVRDICAATGLSVGTLYHHLDGTSLPGLVPPRLPRRRAVAGNAHALAQIAKILRDLASFEDASLAPTPRPRRRKRGSEPALEHEAALAVEGRAVYVTRVKRG